VNPLVWLNRSLSVTLWRWVYVLSGTFQDVSRRFHVFVELELALLHQIKGTHRRYWFTDGAGQKKCRGYHGCRSAFCGDSIPLRTDDLEIIDEGEAHAWYLLLPHEPIDIQSSLGPFQAVHIRTGVLAPRAGR